MKPFNGGAKKDLQNYMNWFMILEKITDNDSNHLDFTYLLGNPLGSIGKI